MERLIFGLVFIEEKNSVIMIQFGSYDSTIRSQSKFFHSVFSGHLGELFVVENNSLKGGAVHREAQCRTGPHEDQLLALRRKHKLVAVGLGEPQQPPGFGVVLAKLVVPWLNKRHAVKLFVSDLLLVSHIRFIIDDVDPQEAIVTFGRLKPLNGGGLFAGHVRFVYVFWAILPEDHLAVSFFK